MSLLDSASARSHPTRAGYGDRHLARVLGNHITAVSALHKCVAAADGTVGQLIDSAYCLDKTKFSQHQRKGYLNEFENRRYCAPVHHVHAIGRYQWFTFCYENLW